MGIASGIFWIVFGLLYILYKAFKEHPDETVVGILVFGIIGGGIIAWHFLFHALLDWNIYVATAFAIVSFGFLIGVFIRMNVSKRREDEKREERKRRALLIAREEPIDEADLAMFERTFWRDCYNSKLYSKEKAAYHTAKDKSQFRDIIIEDYIEHWKVYQVMSRLEQEEKEKEAEKLDD